MMYNDYLIWQHLEPEVQSLPVSYVSQVHPSSTVLYQRNDEDLINFIRQTGFTDPWHEVGIFWSISVTFLIVKNEYVPDYFFSQIHDFSF